MADQLTKDELKELHRAAKKLLVGQANLGQGYKSSKNISRDFDDCKTAQIRASGCVVHFATKVLVTGDHFGNLNSRDFDSPLSRDRVPIKRTPYNHVLIFTGKKGVQRTKVFVGLESHGCYDMHCHDHEKARKILGVLRKRLAKLKA